MQKKLIALAVAGALAAPLAAQAETTIYGKMHMSIDSINNDNSAADKDSSVGISSNSSRIGFKGAEDLGGGLQAVWQTESAIDLAGSESSLSARNSFLGLAGGFGTVIAGRHDTPYKTVGRKVDLFGDTIGDFRSITNANPGVADAVGNDARTNNTIAYITPDMNGLSAALAYVTDVASDTKNDNTDNSAYSLSVNYANGPLFAAIGYQSISSDVFGTDDDQTAARIAASYKLAGLKLNAMYFAESNNGGGNADINDRTGYLLGAAYGMGNNTFKVQYVAAETDESDTMGSKVAVGFDHAMSKATSVYVAYAQVSNDDGVTYNVTGSGHGDQGPSVDGTEAGGSPSAFSVGMTHKF